MNARVLYFFGSAIVSFVTRSRGVFFFVFIHVLNNLITSEIDWPHYAGRNSNN